MPAGCIDKLTEDECRLRAALGVSSSASEVLPIWTLGKIGLSVTLTGVRKPGRLLNDGRDEPFACCRMTGEGGDSSSCCILMVRENASSQSSKASFEHARTVMRGEASVKVEDAGVLGEGAPLDVKSTESLESPSEGALVGIEVKLAGRLSVS